MKPVKATDEKVADEAIEEARVVAKQDSEAVAKMLALLVRDECQVGGHEGLEQRMRLGAVGGAGVARMKMYRNSISLGESVYARRHAVAAKNWC